jgi:hypothetical protein
MTPRTMRWIGVGLFALAFPVDKVSGGAALYFVLAGFLAFTAAMVLRWIGD